MSQPRLFVSKICLRNDTCHFYAKVFNTFLSDVFEGCINRAGKIHLISSLGESHAEGQAEKFECCLDRLLNLLLILKCRRDNF